MSNYTSNLLCHFVGRSKPTDDERFELLKTIIAGGKIIANINNPDNPESYFQMGSQCEHVGEVFGKCDCVCFCDIPNESLSIHTNKYSKFGIGFKKTFIAEQGARPVMYVPQNYNIVERCDSGESGKSSTPREPNNYFPYLLNLSVSLPIFSTLSLSLLNLKSVENLLMSSVTGSGLNLFDINIKKQFFDGKAHSLFYCLTQAWSNQMAYIKLFDASLPDNHPDNYYMEREWRSIGNISFTLEDIDTIYLPNADYIQQFQDAFQTYNGKFFLLVQ